MTTVTTLDSTVIRQAFGAFPSGVALLGARVLGGDHALVASSFMVGVSLNPPLVAVAAQDTSQTWPVLRGAPEIGVSIIGGSDNAHVRQLAGRDRDHRFDGVDTLVDDEGALFLAHAPVRLTTRLHDEVTEGDHTVAFLEVLATEIDPSDDPLIWHRSAFRNLA